MTNRQREPQGCGGRWLALPALAIFCCAGSALLAAVGAGSVGVLLGETTGSPVLVTAGLLLLLAAAARLLVRRRVRR